MTHLYEFADSAQDMETSEVAGLLTLPLELQERIIVEFIQSADTTFDHLKTLRLICKSFDEICYPRVLTRIHLFQGGHYNDVLNNLRRFTAITSSNWRHSMTTTLVIPSWRWVKGDKHFTSFKTMREERMVVSGILSNMLAVPIFYFLLFLSSPDILPKGIFRGSVRLGAKLRMARTSEIRVPTIRRVEWTASKDDPHWITSRTVKWLLKFPQLTELVLTINENQDLRYISHCLSSLHSLNKLTLTFHFSPLNIISARQSVDEFGKVISGNPMITHLELFQSFYFRARQDVSRMFRHVHHALKLEHLGISDNFRDTYAILPHIHSLKSIHVNSFMPTNTFSLLLNERIFPPIIITRGIDQDLTNYIERHPGISRLCINNPDMVQRSRVLSGLVRHSETLEYLSISGPSLCRDLRHIDAELSLLQYKRLQHLVLLSYCSDIWWMSDAVASMSIFARLESLSMLEITDLTIFNVCARFCRESSNTLLNNLVKCMVYAKNVYRDSDWDRATLLA